MGLPILSRKGPIIFLFFCQGKIFFVPPCNENANHADALIITISVKIKYENMITNIVFSGKEMM
jgi:hypothetical protein